VLDQESASDRTATEDCQSKEYGHNLTHPHGELVLHSKGQKDIERRRGHHEEEQYPCDEQVSGCNSEGIAF